MSVDVAHIRPARAKDAAALAAAYEEAWRGAYQGIEKENSGIYEIEDAKCKMGTVDIKLDKDYTVILISRY